MPASKRKNGFTLAELLIVVAIIGVLVAISIPVFTGQLKKAKIAVDQSNVRSAKAAAVAEYFVDGAMGTKTYAYDGSQVYPSDSAPAITGYGKSEEPLPDNISTGIPKDKYVLVTISEDGAISASWGESTSSSATYVADTSKRLEPEHNAAPPIDTTNLYNNERTDNPNADEENNTEEANKKQESSNYSDSEGKIDHEENEKEKDTVGRSEIIKEPVDYSATLSWDTIKDKSAENLPPGTTVSDEDGLYVVYGYNNYYNYQGAKSMSQLTDKYPNSMRKFSFNEDIRDVGDDIRDMTFSEGEIIKHHGKYYVVNQYKDYHGIGDPVTVENETGFFFEMKENKQ